MSQDEQQVEISGMVIGEDENKKVVEIHVVDKVARAQLELFNKTRYPIGYVIRSAIPIEPHVLFGGVWEYDDTNHGLAGEFRYVKIADFSDDIDGGEEDSAEGSEGSPEDTESEGIE